MDKMDKKIKKIKWIMQDLVSLELRGNCFFLVFTYIGSHNE